jgi:hypothetical protein
MTARRGHLDQVQEPSGREEFSGAGGIYAEVLSVLTPHPPSAVHARNDTAKTHAEEKNPGKSGKTIVL